MVTCNCILFSIAFDSYYFWLFICDCFVRQVISIEENTLIWFKFYAKRYWKIAEVKKISKREIFVVGFIYNHAGAIHMREFTTGNELVRYLVTSLLTTFPPCTLFITGSLLLKHVHFRGGWKANEPKMPNQKGQLRLF